MEAEKRTLTTILILVVAAAVLLSCVIGALAGGIAGAVVGRRQAEAAVERFGGSRLQPWPRFRERMPHRWHQEPSWPPEASPWGEPPLEEMLPGMSGVLVVDVIPDSPADQAGLRAGDLITAVDETPIDTFHPLPEVIGRYEPGDRITVHIWRTGQEEAVGVVLAEHPEKPEQAYLGVYFEPLDRP